MGTNNSVVVVRGNGVGVGWTYQRYEDGSICNSVNNKNKGKKRNSGREENFRKSSLYF